MKTNQPLIWLAVAVFGLICAEANGEDVAVVTENHINVRGQPSLTGEVITQMKKGEKVVVLEEVRAEKAKPGEPAKWVRIRMPANTPVWLFASFIDSTNKSVNVSRLNLRAGPGENFSVVGRLERGETVKEIRTIEDWMEIETPAKAYAFMASEFLSKTATKAAPAVAKAEKTEAAPPPTKTEPERTVPPAVTAEKTVPAPTTGAPSSAGTTPALVGEASKIPAPVEAPATPAVPGETTLATTNVAPTIVVSDPASAPESVVTKPPQIIPPPETAPPPPTEPATPPKRIVRREGVVRGTKSIQAPTWYELVGTDTGRTLNYLHTLDPELKLKDFKGKKIVVTGEEGIDPHWPTTPILEIATIAVVP